MDYDRLGFKCGIEIHQQLDTETKLFCRCPVDLEDENPDVKVERRLRSVAGETGEQDKAAEVESMKERKFVYHYHERNNCLVELDEEPPHRMNREALDTALTFARMVGAEIPAEIQVMRKMVVDGSNTSGFQRTSMIGLDGEVETETGTVSIEDIELEEESAGINERTDDKAVYDLSRLGVPLIEVGTDASIQDPEHAREVAEELGMLLRSTGKARRGLGTIRQDVNVSIKDGARVEIKGFQDVRNIDKLIENEVERQKNLVELGEQLEPEDEVLGDNVTHLFEDSENQIISTVLENDGAVYGFKLPGLAGKMKQNISGDRYLALELVDYAKTRGIQGILHTDEEKDYGIQEEFDEIREIFKASEDDVIAVLAGPREKAKEAAKAVKQRAKKIYEGEVPEETRNAEQDFTTSYSRPLPGAARMYPETDIPPIRVTDEKVESIEEELPDTLDERKERYADEIGEELARQIISSKRLDLYESLREDFDDRTVANLLTNTYAGLESDNFPVDNLEEKHFRALLEAFEDEEIAKGDFEEVLTEMAEKGLVQEAIEEVAAGKASEEEIREVVNSVIDEKQDMIEEQGEHAQGALMGIVMGRVEADGGTVSRILGQELGKHLD